MEKPAIEGGKPVRKDFLVFGKPCTDEKEEQNVIETIRSHWLSTGPKKTLFEERIAEYTGAEYAVAVNSCTAALHLSLAVNNIGAGDEVITTPFTFVATVEAITYTGAEPVLVDINSHDGNIDVSKIEQAITEKTKAIMPVHYAGNPCDMDRILEIAAKHNLIVIEDAAHALETKYKGKKIGNIGDYTAFSFYVTKNITSGEGGVITTNNKETAEIMRILSLHGMNKDAWKRYSSDGFLTYDIEYRGFKYNLPDLQASIGLVQMEKIDEFAKKRKVIADKYISYFRDCKYADIVKYRSDNLYAYHLFPIFINENRLNVSRNHLSEAFEKENIGVSIHFPPVHLFTYYKKRYNFKQGDFPAAENISRREITLPLYPDMTEKDTEDVINACSKLFNYYKK